MLINVASNVTVPLASLVDTALLGHLREAGFALLVPFLAASGAVIGLLTTHPGAAATACADAGCLVPVPLFGACAYIFDGHSSVSPPGAACATPCW